MPIPIPEDEPGVKTAEVPSVAERAKLLGLKLPDEGLCALPSGFFGVEQASDLLYGGETLDAKAIFKEAGQTLNLVERGDGKIPYVANHDDTWVGPVLYFSAGLLARNPELVKFAVETVTKYVSEMFKAVVGMKRVKMSYVVEDEEAKKTHKIDFDGPVDQLPEVLKIVKGLKK